MLSPSKLIRSLLVVPLCVGADLPIRQVILYKSGVGYFERSGQLGPGEAARLDFKASEMNDVLKSLTVADRSGAAIAGLRYDSAIPLADRLSDSPFHLGEAESLSAFLDSVKGARIEIKTSAETLTGTILSARITGPAGQNPERQFLVLLLDGGDIRTVDLGGVTSLKFTDGKLQLQLREALAALNSSRSKEKRSVYIDSPDGKARDVTASYTVPAPVWKSSYRLIFGPSGEPTLEGWAIVDNTTGEDWQGVQLAVVSGRPVSFISRLYEPRYLQRATVELPEDRALGPVLYGGNMEAKDALAGVAGGVPGGTAGGVIGGILGGVPTAAPPPPAAMEQYAKLQRTGASRGGSYQPRANATSTVDAATTDRDLGDLFEYRFSHSVTVKKDESAMLPFLQSKIAARKLLIYQDNTGTHPITAAELTNTTGKTLDGGPLTVFEGNSYSGEALMETLKNSDKRLIGYAVDLGTRITTAYGGEENTVREIHMNRGVLTARTAQRSKRTYTIRNVDSRAKTLLIEDPVRPDYKLLSPAAAERTEFAYRFEVKLAPAATATLPVEEERLYDQTTILSSATPDVLGFYVENKALSASAHAQLSRVLELKRQISDADRALAQAEAELRDITNDEGRIRQNIRSLNEVSGQGEQVQKYAAQLANGETKLAATRDRLGELRRRRAELSAQLDALIGRLEF